MGGVSADGRVLWLSGRYNAEVYAISTRAPAGCCTASRSATARTAWRLAAARPLLDRAHRHPALTAGLRCGAMSRPSVLVVDDDAPVRRMLERTLGAEGYDVCAAADGGAALAAVERAVPDLVVLDVAMPGLDGLAVARRLRGKRLATPILLLTARDGVADRVAGLDAGADDYLLKPFAPEELLARVRALLRRGAPCRTTLAFGDLTLDVAAGARRARRARPRADAARGGAARAAAAQGAHGRLARARAGGGVGRRAARRARTSSTATSPTCGASSATRR